MKITASGGNEKIPLPEHFEAFCRGGEAVAEGEGEDGRYDGSAVCSITQKLYEGPVDLDAVDTELDEMAQRRIARSEVVEGDLDPVLMPKEWRLSIGMR